MAHSIARTARRLVLRLALACGVGRLMRRHHRDRVIVLMYHGFSAGGTTWRQNPEGNHVDIAAFRRQVEYLARHHTILPLAALVDAIAGKRSLPPSPVVLTMDDGYRSNYLLALPVLRDYSASASVFVTTQFVDEGRSLWPDRVALAIGNAAPRAYDGLEIAGVAFDLRTEPGRRHAFHAAVERLKTMPQAQRETAIERIESILRSDADRAGARPDTFEPLSWSQAREMQASGLVDLGNHTHTHPILARCAPSTQRAEIETAHALMSRNLGRGPSLFCYPNGGLADFDQETIAIVRSLGYTGALTTERGYNDLTTDPFLIRRVAVNSAATIDDFVTILYGGWKALARDLFSRPRSAANR